MDGKWLVYGWYMDIFWTKTMGGRMDGYINLIWFFLDQKCGYMDGGWFLGFL